MRVVKVVAIDPNKYPKFANDPNHPFAGMDAEARVKEIDDFCARLWARTRMKKAREKAHADRDSMAQALPTQLHASQEARGNESVKPPMEERGK